MFSFVCFLFTSLSSNHRGKQFHAAKNLEIADFLAAVLSVAADVPASNFGGRNFL